MAYAGGTLLEYCTLLETLQYILLIDIAKFLKMWNSFGGNYVQYENIQGHDLLDFAPYVHITSPIRRLIDLLNIMVLQDSLELLAFNEH